MAVALPYYNLFVGIGVASAAALYQRRLENAFEDRRTRERALLLLLLALPTAAIGSWLFDRLVGASTGPVLPLRGLAFYGGLLGAMGAALVAAPLLRVPLLRMLDAAAPCIALGHAIGRIGCSAVGCCYGQRVGAHSVWRALGLERVPTQWLESIALFAVAAFLQTRDTARRAGRDGDLLVIYFVSYGVVRFALETQRDDVRGALPFMPDALSPAQWISMALVFTGASIAATRARRPTLPPAPA